MRSLETALRDSLWASALTPRELEQVIHDSYERHLPVGGHAVRCGEPSEHWFGVAEGLLKMSVSLADGRHSTFTGVPAGGWAGEGSLLRGVPWRYDAVAVRPTRIVCLPRHTFQRLVDTSLPFNHFLLRQLNARLALFIGLVEYDRLLGPEARIARCIASLFDPDLYPRTGNFVQLSQEEIGLLSAVSRQRTNAALHALERDGLLRVEFGGVTVLDVNGLRRHLGQRAAARQRLAVPPAAGAGRLHVVAGA